MKLVARSVERRAARRCSGTTAIPSTDGRRRRRSRCASSSASRRRAERSRRTARGLRVGAAGASWIDDALERSGLRGSRAGAPERGRHRQRDRQGRRPGRDPSRPGRRCAGTSAAAGLDRLPAICATSSTDHRPLQPGCGERRAARPAQRRPRPDRRGRPARRRARSRARSSTAPTNMTDRLRRSRVLTLHSGRGPRRGARRVRRALCATSRSSSTNGSRCRRRSPKPATLDRVQALMRHPAFSIGNPNRVRALIGSFAMLNQTQFNRRGRRRLRVPRRHRARARSDRIRKSPRAF